MSNLCHIKQPFDYYELSALTEQRDNLTMKFGLDIFKNERHDGFIEEKVHVRPNSRLKHIIQEQTCKTDRYKFSATPYLSKRPNNVITRKTSDITYVYIFICFILRCALCQTGRM